MKLEGKTAIITGASRGIGAAIVKRFAAEGAAVLINYRSGADKAQNLAETIRSGGGQVEVEQGDIGNAEDMARMCAACVERFGGLDILINNAGWARLEPLDEIKPDHLHAQLQTNIAGTIFATQAASRVMRDGGRIINITSIAAKGGAGGSVYSATKAAGNALTKCYAAELGPRGITVNAVAPAAVETDLYFEVGLDRNRQAALAATPLGRDGSVEDVAQAVLFLASDEAAWITGEIVQVSGGRAM